MRLKLSKSSIVKLVESALENIGGSCDYNNKQDNFHSEIVLDNIKYNMFIDYTLSDEKVIIWVYLPVSGLSSDHYPAVNELIAKINGNAQRGYFQAYLHDDETIIRFKAELDHEGAELYSDVLQDIMAHAINQSHSNIDSLLELINQDVKINNTEIKTESEKFCMKCNHSNPKDSNFCAECGYKLLLACSKCGTIPSVGANFCRECGFKL